MIERFCSGGLPRPQFSGWIGSKPFKMRHSASLRSPRLKPASKKGSLKINEHVLRQQVCGEGGEMVGNLLLALAGFGPFAFMVNRLYVGIGERQINVKGITYSRYSTPIAYWIVMMLAIFGLCWGLLMGCAGVMLLFQ